MRRRTMLIGLGALVPALAIAGRRDRAAEAVKEQVTDDRGPAASASEIPALARLLEKAQWTPTPELAGIFHAGHIFEVTEMGHRPLADTCVLATPRENTYTSAELVTSLQAGVAVNAGLGSAAASGSLVRKIKFGTPVQVSVPALDLVITEECVAKLQRLPVSRLQNAYVIQEVLRAEIAEQTCGRMDASGRIVGLGAAEAEYARACAQTSLEPVAVGYRTVPLTSLLDLGGAVLAAPTGPGVTTGNGGTAGGSFDGVSGIAAQIQQAEALKAKLESDLKVCLQGEASKVRDAAQRDWSTLGQLRSLAETEAGRQAAEAQVKRFVALYENKGVTCRNDLGERSERVTAAEVADARAFLDAPMPGAAGIEWVRIPGGSFQMGSNDRGKDEKPVHSVRVSSFELTKTEVTVGQYNQCVNAGACTPAHTSDGTCRVYDGSTWEDGNLPSGFQGSDHPVVCVDWTQAQAFANWAGGRLPTEAEWEYAARSGGKSWTYPWGNESATCSRAILNGGGKGCGQDRTWPVCSKPSGNSTQGVCDLAGNVWEWVQDGYHDSYSGAPAYGRAWGGGAASIRVGRGGGWGLTASFLRASGRYGFDPTFRSDYLGFRLAR